MKTLFLSIIIILVFTSCDNNLHLSYNSTTNEFSIISDRYYISKVRVGIMEQYYDSSFYEIICIDPKYGVSQLPLLDSTKGYQYTGALNDSIIKMRDLYFDILVINRHKKEEFWFDFLLNHNAPDTIYYFKRNRIM